MRTMRDRLLEHRDHSWFREANAVAEAAGSLPEGISARDELDHYFNCPTPVYDDLHDQWEELAYPSVRLSHRLAASLSCTSASDLRDEDCVPPWSVFYLHVPTDLLIGKLGPITGALFVRRQNGVEIHFGMGDQANGMTSAFSMAELCQDFEPKWQSDAEAVRSMMKALGNDEQSQMSHQTQRAAASLRRLFVGVIFELNAPRMQELIALGPPRKRPSKRRSDIPTTWDFKLVRDVVLDVREEVRRYCLGGGGR